MKYLKLFEGYEEIKNDIRNCDIENFQKDQKIKILNYLLKKELFNVEDYLKIMDHIVFANYSTQIFTISKYSIIKRKNFSIYKLKDDYYMLTIYKSKNYKCDQLEGLKKCLLDKLINKI